MSKVKLIVAHDLNRGIGYRGKLPWFIPGELKWVAETTKATKDRHKKNAVVMGRNTWESIPEAFKPLRDRINVVIRSNETQDEQLVDIFYRSLEKAMIDLIEDPEIEDLFIFGGAKLYEYSLSHGYVDEILVTEVQEKYKADAYFPEIPEEFYLESEEEIKEYSIPVIRKKYVRK